MSAHALAWTLFALVLAVTFYLAWLGHRRTKTFADFAVGGRSMGPLLAGTTLGACLASTATFVINPGFVYAYGLPALIALTLPLFAGVLAGLLILGPGFRRFGATATTLPAWLGERYGSEALRLWFAALSLLHVFYVVLIVVGAAYVMQATMAVSYATAVSIVTGVVFSYVLLGGTYAHAYTNTAQGAVMLVVAVLIGVVAGRDILAAGDGSLSAALGRLAEQDPHLVALVHPTSPFYRNVFEVLVAPFVIGFALVAQPHLLVKSLYLRDGKDMVKFGVTGFACFVIFSLVLLGGLAARLGDGGGMAQDVAMSAWLSTAFPPAIGAVVSVAILAAAMSTLDGLLVAVSAIVGGDLIAHRAVAARLGATDDEARGRLALNAGRVTVIALGGVAWLVAQQPPALVGIFGTVGAYGLLVASLPAIVLGIALERPPAPRWIALGSLLGLAVHGGLYFGGVTINTGITACAGLAVSLPVPLLAAALTRRPVAAPVTAAEPVTTESRRLEPIGV